MRQYLHSNMVRFIIKNMKKRLKTGTSIYIPIWLDLLCAWTIQFRNVLQIYIPIWLDLL